MVGITPRFGEQCLHEADLLIPADRLRFFDCLIPIRAGLAEQPPGERPKGVDALYVPAQDEAQAAGIGLWGTAPTPVPTPAPTPVPAAAAPIPLVPQPGCEPSYPDPGVCIPVGAADLDCGEIAWRRFTVLWNVPNPDPHGFDGEGDGIGCES